LDFPTFLVLSAAVTGVIWAMDLVLWAPKRKLVAGEGGGEIGTGQRAPRGVREPIVVEYARAFFPVILIVLVLRSFLVEPFRIPSNSMMPTLLTGDFILVNKFAFGIRLPVMDKKVFQIGEPQRGDVVVFRYPVDPGTDFIKRVIGLPGDHIAYSGKQVYINGEPMPQDPLGTYLGVGAGAGMTGASERLEHLGSVDHDILVRPQLPDSPQCRVLLGGDFVVPADQYFVMGDNRDHSSDSRCWGTVPEQNLVGKAFMIWMNWDWSNGGVSWDRIGTLIN